MGGAVLSIFNEELIKSLDNPFRYPHPPRRPPFIIGGERIVEWFRTRYQESIGQGSKISYIVGLPGAGKSHFLSHIEYLFYSAEKDNIKGIYAIYNASSTEINEKQLWEDFFWNENVLQRLRSIIDSSKIKNTGFPLGTQSNLIKLLDGQLDLTMLDARALHSMAECVSKILVNENLGMCIAIDNIDEYFRAMTEKYSERYPKEEARNRVAASLLGAIRVLTAGLDQIVVLLACTQDVYEQITQARVDATYGRRIEMQQWKLKELTPYQSIELVNKYLDWWAKNHGVEIPVIENGECSLIDANGKKLNTYPFSLQAIEYFHKVTRSMPGDIVCLCGQCINDMRYEGNVSIVKEATIYYALEEIRRLYPQLVLKAELINQERPRYMKPLMEKRLKILLQTMNRVGSDVRRIVDAIEKYKDEFGILEEPRIATTIFTDNAHTMPLGDNSAIWNYKGTKILVKFIIGADPSLDVTAKGSGFKNEVGYREWEEARSFLEDQSTGISHVLFITRWTKPLVYSSWYSSGDLGILSPVVQEFSLDGIINMIAGATEDYSEYRKDLIQHIEQFSVHLIVALDTLIEKRKSEQSLEDVRRKNKEAATSF